MNLTLNRKAFRDDGIFSELRDTEGNLIAVTLEHSYDKEPKLPLGTFTCKRGPHRLHGMTEDFETFEITGVEGHTDILFHWGNFQKDSEGCVLLGDQIAKNGADGCQMILHSRATFARFMELQKGVDTFQLVVTA